MRVTRTRWGPILSAAIGAGVIAAHASGQTECPTCRTEKFIQGLPKSYDAVLVVNDATRQRRSGPGRALGSMLEEAGALPETARAWRELAHALDWSGEQAFDQLLGRKFTLVVRGLDGAGPPDWAVLTEVPPEAELRLRQRLRAAPRGNVAGLAVLFVEDGKYELMVGRGPAADPGLVPAGVEATATVLLGPGGENPLFTELAPSLRSRTGLASPPAPWRAGQKERDCDIVLMMRRKAPVDGRAGAGERTLTLTATMERDGWDAHLVCSRGLAWGQPAGGRAIRPWSDAGFRMVEREALLAVVGVVSGSPRLDAGMIPGLSGLFPVPGAWLGGAAEGRLGALFIHPSRRRTQGASTPRGGEPAAAYIVADGELPRQAASTASEPLALLGQWCITAGFEVADGSRAPSEVYGLATRMLGALQTGETPEAAGSPAELFGTDAGFHSVQVDESLPIHESLAVRLTRLVGQEPVITWGAKPVRGPVVAAAKSGRGAELRPGWCVVSLAPSGEAMAETDAGLLAMTGGTSRARLSMGMIRPCALASVLGRDDGTIPAWARRIGSLRWDAWVRDDGMVETSLSLKMAP